MKEGEGNGCANDYFQLEMVRGDNTKKVHVNLKGRNNLNKCVSLHARISGTEAILCHK